MFVFGLLVGLVAGVMVTGLGVLWLSEWTSRIPIRSVHGFQRPFRAPAEEHKAYDLEPEPLLKRTGARDDTAGN